jgi:hypothetical protein
MKKIQVQVLQRKHLKVNKCEMEKASILKRKTFLKKKNNKFLQINKTMTITCFHEKYLPILTTKLGLI